jgi:hypothetical protein
MATLYDTLLARIAVLETQGKGSLVPPAAILWTDCHGEWREQVAVLGTRRTVLTLGDDLSPESRTGPALWIRCMLARALPDDLLPADVVPVIYLPGIAREDLRAVEDCPAHLRPLAELQYRSVFFSHPNGKDWTVSAWLSHKGRGAGIDIAADQETHAALVTAQSVLFEQEVESLRGRVLRASDLLELLVPDEVADLLRWLDDETAFRSGKSPQQWQAFVSQVAHHFNFDAEGDGVLAAAERLAERQGEWERVWTRFADAPRRCPGVAAVLRRAAPSTLMPSYPDSWPQLNDQGEESLRMALGSVRQLSPDKARDALAALELEHGWRRASVWHELGETPLADALEHLAALAEHTERTSGGASPLALAETYAHEGFKADDAYLRALACAKSASDLEAVQSAASALYRPWVEAGARALQEVMHAEWPAPEGLEPPEGTCVLFCDGLRFDLGRRLSAVLDGFGVEVEVAYRLSAIPTLTASAKPAATSVVVAALGTGDEFTPAVSSSGKSATTEVVRALMSEAGWQILAPTDWGNPDGRAWTEMGDIDALGHKVETKMVAHIDSELGFVAERVRELLGSGWDRVVVVTDHGWLLMPDKLPKVDLPKHLAEPRSGRCARLRDEAEAPPGVVMAPWTWDEAVRIALAPGIATFVEGKRYDHGGVSPQECVIPQLTCTMPSSVTVEQVEIATMRWVGLRLRVGLAGAHAGCALDLRRKAADPDTSFCGGVRPIDDEGAGALLVHDDQYMGEAAVLVVLDAAGNLLLQRPTVIGGED